MFSWEHAPNPVASGQIHVCYIIIFIQKKNILKCFLRQIYIRIFTKTHQVVPHFKKFLEETCPPKHSICRTIELPSSLTV